MLLLTILVFLIACATFPSIWVLGCLTYLLQNMAKNVQEEIANESKLVKVLLYLGTGGHSDYCDYLFWPTTMESPNRRVLGFESLIIKQWIR